MKTLKKFFVLMIMTLPLMVAAVVGASAQSLGDKYIVVDFNRVQEESLVGQHVISQLTQYGNAVQARKEALEAGLNAEGEELEGQESILPQDVFQDRVTAFQQKARRAEIELQGYRQIMVRAEQNAKLEITNNLKPIISQIMTEKGADMVFDKSLVYMTKGGFDVTDLVIQRLDSKLTTYPLNLQPPSLSGQ